MAAAREVPGLSGRQRYGVIAMTPGNTKVALVRQQEDGAWQFPSLLPRREAVRLEDELEAALDAAEQQLGLDVASTMCSQPVIHALGPGSKETTKFFLAFNVPEANLVPADGAAAVASWEDLQALQEETAERPVAGNQLVAVLRQLQAMSKRRFEMVMPADSEYQEVSALLSWHEVGGATWRGPAPKDFLEQHCAAHKLPAPCFNVFERDRTPTRTHFCVTVMLPHLGLQLAPDAVYTSPVDAMQNAALLALMYLEGALAPDCPLVTFAAAGEMAQIPHAFVTEHELRQDARQQQADLERVQQREAEEADRRKSELERQVQAEQAALQRRLDELKRQQAALAAGGVPMGALPGELDQQAAAGPAGFERLPKRPKVEKAALTLGQALGQLPLDKHPLMAIKELCDKCRFPQPHYEELAVPGSTGTRVAVTIPQAGVTRSVGPPHEDKKLAKLAAVQIVMDTLRRRHPVEPT